MRISRLTISGFRGILNADLRLGKHTVLVGPNNVGKTTIIEALALLFGRDRLVRELTEHDFFGSAPQHQTRIAILATLTDFETDDPSDHREWFSVERGVEKWLDGDGAVHPSKDEETWKLAVQIGFCARFNVETLEAETARFFVDDDSDVGDPFDEDAIVRRVPGRLIQDVGFFLVPATRTWDRWISFSSELFRRLIGVAGEIPATAVRAERDRLWNPPDRLENAAGIAGIVANINGELAHLISQAPELQFRLTSTDSQSVLQAVVPHFKHAAAPSLPSSRHGSGLASLQSLLLLMQFGAARKDSGKCFILAVEEPELHVQPSQQKRLVNRLNAVSNQAVMTTHSPSVASMFPPTDVVFLHSNGGALTGSPLSLRTAEPSNHEQHLLYGWRDRLIAALMHEYVLIPEGVSDVAWLEALQTAIELRQDWASIVHEPTRFGTFVGVAPTADAKVTDTYQLVRTIHGQAFCLVDGDSAGLIYLSVLKALEHPPRLVLVWPHNWTLEHVIAWIADAGADPVRAALAKALGVPLPDGNALKNHLATHKSYAPTHLVVAEVLARFAACRSRGTNFLNDIADIARGAGDNPTHFAFWPEQSTQETKVWRLNP